MAALSPSRRRIPKLGCHKATGQAVVRLNGRDHYLGRHGSAESKAAYDRAIAEWLVRGREENQAAANGPASPARGTSFTVSEVILAYKIHTDEIYRSSPSERGKVRLSLRPLRQLYGLSPANEFGPLALRTVRDHLLSVQRRGGVESGTRQEAGATAVEYRLSRRTVNARIGMIKRMFKWAASVELVPVAVFQALATVEGLKKGRSSATEPKKVSPVPAPVVEATLQHVGRHVRGMIEFQLLTGARSGEVCQIRRCDIDTANPNCWRYTPSRHKTEYRDQERIVFIGPKAQAVLAAFSTESPTDYLFSPERAMEERLAELRGRRRCKVYPSSHRRHKSQPKRKPGPRYTVHSYRQAIYRACKCAVIPRWHPHQLRHAAATRLRKAYGVETARIILGHQNLSTTEIYAEPNHQRAAEVMGSVG
jgi:integrase